MVVRRLTNPGSILGIAIRVPDVSASKCVKTASLEIVGAPTRAVDKDSDRMWADEVSSADGDLMTSAGSSTHTGTKSLGCIDANRSIRPREKGAAYRRHSNKYEVPPAKLPECGASWLMRTTSDSHRA